MWPFTRKHVNWDRAAKSRRARISFLPANKNHQSMHPLLFTSGLPLAALLPMIVVACSHQLHAGTIVTARTFVYYSDGFENRFPVVNEGPVSAEAFDLGTSTLLGGSGAAAAKAGGLITPKIWYLNVATSADARRLPGARIEAANVGEATASISSDLIFSRLTPDVAFPSIARMHYIITGGPLTVDVTNVAGFQTYGEAKISFSIQSSGGRADTYYTVSNDNGVPFSGFSGFGSDALSLNGEFAARGYLDIHLTELDPLTSFASVLVSAVSRSSAQILDRNPDRAPIPDGLEVSVFATSDFSHTVRPLGFTLLDGTPLEDVGITYSYAVDNVQSVPEPASLTLWGIGGLCCVIGANRRRK